MTTIYGIKNCDTVKKALKWLDQQGLNYQFHDFRKDGISLELVEQFVKQSDWQQLVNKRSTTYRNLAAEVKDSLNESNVAQVLVDNPTLIKRPVLIHQDNLVLGFKADNYQQVFSNE